MSFSLTVKDCDSNNPISGASVGETGDYTTNSQGQLIFSDCDDLSACAGDSGLTVSGLTTIPASGAAVNTALFSVSSFGVKGNTAISIATSGWSTSQVSLERATVRPSSTTIYNSVAIPDNLSSSQITYTLTATTTGNVSATGSVVQEASEYVLHWNEAGNTGTTLTETLADYSDTTLTYNLVSTRNNTNVAYSASTISPVGPIVSTGATSVDISLDKNLQPNELRVFNIVLRQTNSKKTISATIRQPGIETDETFVTLADPAGTGQEDIEIRIYASLDGTSATMVGGDDTLNMTSLNANLYCPKTEDWYFSISWTGGNTHSVLVNFDGNEETMNNGDIRQFSQTFNNITIIAHNH